MGDCQSGTVEGVDGGNKQNGLACLPCGSATDSNKVAA
jgi:hypothetical protein